MPKKKINKPLIVGAIKTSIQGPGTLTHEGGDPILVSDVEGGLPGEEHTLVFEGAIEMDEEGVDVFVPSDASKRSLEIGEAAVIRSLGQANVSLNKKEAEELAANSS